MTEVDIGSPVTLRCAGGALRFEPDGHVTLMRAGGPASIALVPDLELSKFLELWCGEDWACFVGEKGRAVWCAWPETGKIVQVCELDRLDLRGGYDPGGLHRVQFQGLPDGDLLIVHEIGVARLSRNGRLCWQRVHDDLASRLHGLDDDVVWFQGEYERFGFSLTDGRPVVA